MSKPIKVMVFVTDNHKKKVAEYPILVDNAKEIRKQHENISRFLWREHWVKFEWNDGLSMIYGCPYTVKEDEKKVDRGAITDAILEQKYFPEKAIF